MEWHGYKIGDRAIHIGKLPGRKRICLYEVNGSVCTPLSYFADEQKAAIALDMLDLLLRAQLYRNEF